MLNFRKIFTTTKKIIIKKTKVDTILFKLKNYTNGISWVNPIVFSSTTSIYTKDDNRSYLNKIIETEDGYTVTNETSSFVKKTNTYTFNNNPYITPNFGGTGLLFGGTTNRSITIPNAYSAFIEFEVLSYSQGNSTPNVTFDIFINGENKRSIKMTNAEFNILRVITVRHLIQIIIFVTLGRFVIHYLPNKKEDIVIEVKNVVSQYPIAIGITKVEYESTDIGNKTYNDVVIYATER